MADVDTDRLLFIVTGVDLVAELGDRPMAYRIEADIRRLLAELLPPPEEGAPPEPPLLSPVVVSDVYFLNHEEVCDAPAISIGGPGVNALSGLLAPKVPTVVAIDQALVVQLDLDGVCNQSCVWGMTHLDTIRAVELFISKGYLETFVRGAVHAAMEN